MFEAFFPAFSFVVLVVVGVVWLRDRERELQADLRGELLLKLKRKPAHLCSLLDELRRTRSARLSRICAVLAQLEREGWIASQWSESDDGRPQRVYTVVTDLRRLHAELEPAVALRRG